MEEENKRNTKNEEQNTEDMKEEEKMDHSTRKKKQDRWVLLAMLVDDKAHSFQFTH